MLRSGRLCRAAGVRDADRRADTARTGRASTRSRRAVPNGPEGQFPIRVLPGKPAKAARAKTIAAAQPEPRSVRLSAESAAPGLQPRRIPRRLQHEHPAPDKGALPAHKAATALTGDSADEPPE